MSATSKEDNNGGVFWGQADLDDFDVSVRCASDEEMETERRIKFPWQKLYGRDKELAKLHQIYDSISSSEDTNSTAAAVFLGGLSGTGKSALVNEFTKQLTKEKKKRATLVAGKFGKMNSGYPFSAITRGLNHFLLELLENSTDAELQALQKRLAEFQIAPNSDEAIVLQDTLVPALPSLFQKGAKPARSRSIVHSMGHDLNAIKLAFEKLVQALATPAQPLILFIDDWQWADGASIQLLGSLLKAKSLSHVLFVGAYRTNELKPEHDFVKLMKDTEESKGADFVASMEIFNLSPQDIAQFIADAINREPDEIAPVTEAVYSKTLGNIFFVRQALEELVRKNALYYDLVFFRWQFGDVSQVELEKFLSDDVIGMVQSKLQTLPVSLQKALSLAAYTNNTIELDLLMALLQAYSVPMESKKELSRLMKKAYNEGLVMIVKSPTGGNADSDDTTTNHTYKFAHDRIREAACFAVPEGNERYQMLRKISTVLLEQSTEDWMLFTAARHLNSIPPDLTPEVEAVELNLQVGKIAIGKGAFGEAVVFLRVADERLDPDTCWNEHYVLNLDVKNTLMEAVLSLGNSERALEISQEILAQTKSLADKSRAHYVQVEALSENNKEYEKALEGALEILKLYGIDHIGMAPTVKQVKREKFRLRLALRGRSLGCIAKFPVATQETVLAKIRIAQMATRLANFGKLPDVTAMLGNRVLREVLSEKAITKDLPSMLVMLGGPLRQEENFEGAIACANAAILVMERFPGERGVEHAKAKMSLYGTLTCLQMPFKDAIETFLELNRQLLSKGVNGMGLGAGMLGMYAFLNASLPLDALLEPKLLLLEETAQNLGMKTFVVVFSLIRQCLYNLQGGKKASSVSTEIKGAACNEDEVKYQFEGASQKMTNRDIGIIRLQLAVIFNDEATMEQMLERLDEFPVYDMPVERQHLRMSFMGIAALILAADTSKKEDKKKKLAQKWAKTCMTFFEKLSRFGSPNAQPVHLCLKALHKPSQSAFDDAINTCSNLGLYNLAGLMNERCGLWLLDKSKSSGGNKKDNKKKKAAASSSGAHEEYLKRALWFYHDWGATAKVQQMQSNFWFLSSAAREEVPSQLGTVKRNAAMLGLAQQPQATETSDTQH